jgi:hypothetical protein
VARKLAPVRSTQFEDVALASMLIPSQRVRQSVKDPCQKRTLPVNAAFHIQDYKWAKRAVAVRFD